MTITIRNRWTKACMWEGDAESVRGAVVAAVKSGAYLGGADLGGAYLRGADLRNANLSNADLRDADLSGAHLGGADLRNANLSNANLSGANLSGANLSSANLTGACLGGAYLGGAYLGGAYLRDAYLRDAYLMPIKADVWEVLAHAIPELPSLASALRDGRVNGSVYEGECACLCGTIANARHVAYEALTGITPDSRRAAERFFLAIQEGDKPETNPACKLALEWVEEFQRLVAPDQLEAK